MSEAVIPERWTEEYEEACIRALYQCFPQDIADRLAPARWKDGIDINYLSGRTRLFIHKVIEAKVAAQAATIAALELRLSDQHATIVRDAATIERLTEALQRLVEASVEEFGPSRYDTAMNKARAALNPQPSQPEYIHFEQYIKVFPEPIPGPSQPEYTSESMVQQKEKP
jgi:uncharacterized coiled-coil protein SlyX